MESGTTNLPLATPIRFPGFRGETRVNRATGRPLRAMMISSSLPVSICSSSFESVDLAWNVFTMLMAIPPEYGLV